MKTKKYIYPLTALILIAGVAPSRAQEIGTLRQLGFAGGEPRILDPGKSLTVPVGKTATVLRFQQTLVPGAPVAAWKAANMAARDKGDRLPDRLTVAQYVVRYADGRELPVNVRYGESVGAWKRDWWNAVDGFIYDLAFAPVAWTQPLEKDGLEHAVIYRMEWPNPRPAVAIESVTLKAAPGLEGGRLLVFDVTTGNKPRPGNTYFVAPTGDDAGPGSFDKPWATLHQAAATIKAGDTVYVRGGTYRPTKRIVFKYLDAPVGQRTSVIGWPGETAEFDFMDAHWDESAERRVRGFEHYPQDESMIMAFDCDRFTFKNLHLSHSRARGFGMDTGWSHFGYKPKHLRDGGQPEQVNDEPFDGGEILYCSTYRVFSAGIRFARAKNGRLIGNTLIRPQSISMGPADKETVGFGPVAGLGATTFVNRDGKKQRNPPMEGIDCGRLFDSVIAYNEICWGDKECLLIDGDVDGLRVHHNYVHNAHNRPWVGGIAPNGYGKQQNIEIDHNLAHDVGGAYGVGAEGGGFTRHIRIHHNLGWNCFWNAVNITGAWKDAEASLSHVFVYNNTSWHDGYLDDNKGPSGGISVAFPRTVGALFAGKKVELKNSSVTDVTVADNLILQPRDYAQALLNDGDPVAARIVFTHNLTDLVTDSERINGKNNPKWHSVRDDKLIVTAKPVLRDPAKRDFRLLPGTPAIDCGIVIDDAGKPATGKTYIGAFGPDANWVEADK